MSGDLRSCPFCGGEPILRDHDMWPMCSACQCEGPGTSFGISRKRAITLWNTRALDPAVAALEAEVARLRADVTYERGLNGREAERIFTLSLLNDEIEVLTNAASSFDVQDGIALAAFRKRLVGLWRARDRLPAPSEKEAG